MSSFEQAKREQEERNFRDYLQRLINSESITGDAAGITRQVIAQGRESLSDTQEFIFNKNVMETYGTPTCEQCETHVPYDQVFIDPFQETLYCASCQHDHNRFNENHP